jgi:hypothetical protein
MWTDFGHLVTNVTNSPTTLLYFYEVIPWFKDFGNPVVTQLIKLIRKVPALYGGANIAQCGDYTVGLTTEQLGFDSQQRRDILPFFKVFIPALGPTQPSFWIGPEDTLENWPNLHLTIYLHLVLRLSMHKGILHFPHIPLLLGAWLCFYEAWKFIIMLTSTHK